MSRVGLLLALLGSAAASAQDTGAARFGLIIGVNRSVDEGMPTLRYADDDAAKYQDLFRSLGVRTYLLTRLDEGSARLFPQAAAEARAPIARELRATASAIAADVRTSRERGIPTELYVVYAGHGHVQDGRGYVSLEDERLTARVLLDSVIDVVKADAAHVVIDACYSYFMAYGRGAGGERRSLSGFTPVPELAGRPQLGLLLSTSSAKESHEWEGFQSGVFSHEIRSGLYGAADADRDGRVSYREIAAFVQKANAAIENERFRPEVLARAPSDGRPLADLRPGLVHSLEVPEGFEGRYLLEDSRGVRLLDFHSAPGESTTLVRPPAGGTLYLTRPADGVEYALPAGERVSVADLSQAGARVAGRGGAHQSFTRVFELPFARADAETFALPPPPAATVLVPVGGVPNRDSGRAQLGALSFGGTLLFGVSGFGLITASVLHRNDPFAPAEDRPQREATANGLATAGGALLVGAAGCAAAGLYLLFLPPERTTPPKVAFTAAPLTDGVAVFAAGAF